MQHRSSGRARSVLTRRSGGPTNLPLQLTRFVGRDREVAELQRLLEGGRCLTVTGTGGMGKTRLALAVADELVPHFADGVWLVELAPLADADLVPQAVAASLQMGEVPTRPSAAALAEMVGARRLLLLLDNCEHLVQACAALTEHLLRSCPHLRILATSREPLGVPGEVVWRIPPLSTPDPRQTAAGDEIAGSEAVRLFLDRVRLVSPRFVIDERNAAAVVDICSRLDGIPLAIELAAARAGLLGLVQLARRLDDRFRLLTSSSRTADSRQQTLQATLDWSYRLLMGPERTLFQRLAMFPGGVTLEMAEAVCSGDGIDPSDVLDVLGRLVDKSLVISDALAGDTRYRQLETLRHYAWDRLSESGAGARLRGRHAVYFADLAEEAGAGLVGPDQASWVDRLEVEHDNLRAALAWLVESGDAERSLRLARGLWRFWSYRGYLAEGHRWLTAVLDLPATDDLLGLRADALFGSGRLAHQQGDYEAARPLYEESLLLARRIGHAEAAIGALAQLGHLAFYADDPQSARALYKRALSTHVGPGRSGAVATALAGLAYLEQLRGEYGHARDLYSEGLAHVEALGDQSLMAYLLCRLGELDHDEGRFDDARDRFRAGLAIYQALRARTRLIGVLENLAGLMAALGRPERALRLAGAAEALRDAIGARPLSREASRLARILEPVRRDLGDGRAAALWAEGRTMSLEQALDYAQDKGCVDGSGVHVTPAQAIEVAPAGVSAGTGPLTQREAEVAVLIARGATNREIAEALVITERTVEAHVTHILTKLSLRSRAQVAVWVLERGLLPAERP